MSSHRRTGHRADTHRRRRSDEQPACSSGRACPRRVGAGHRGPGGARSARGRRIPLLHQPGRQRLYNTCSDVHRRRPARLRPPAPRRGRGRQPPPPDTRGGPADDDRPPDARTARGRRAVHRGAGLGLRRFGGRREDRPVERARALRLDRRRRHDGAHRPGHRHGREHAQPDGDDRPHPTPPRRSRCATSGATPRAHEPPPVPGTPVRRPPPNRTAPRRAPRPARPRPPSAAGPRGASPESAPRGTAPRPAPRSTRRRAGASR